MSTRCQIGVYESKESKLQDFEVLLYRHSDGYPGDNVDENGVLTDIVPFLQWWKKKRGIGDAEYCGARLLQWLCDNDDHSMSQFSKQTNQKDDVNETFTGYLGYGICKDFHGDIDYFYKVYPNAIEVYHVGNIWQEFHDSEFKLVQTIQL